jgi:cytochrome c553
MPNFGLKKKEAEALASFLLSQPSKASKPFTTSKGDALQGKQLINQMGCANCHELEGAQKISAPALAALSSKTGGCLEAGHANYDLNPSDQSAIQSALRNQQSLSQHIGLESSQRAIEQLNCVACHERDGQQDLWSKHSLESEQWKVTHKNKGHLAQDRPDLTHAGEKLNHHYVNKLLKGTLGYQARPWLLAKMPSFPSRADRISQGLTSQHGVSLQKTKVKQNKQHIDLGHQLSGVQGFSCIVCHGVGQSRPLAAFEVEGINLARIADRLRPGFYERWMYDPTRIDSNTKMPRYASDDGKTSLSHIQGGNAKIQFEAIWQYLQKGLKMKKPQGLP